MVDTDRGPGPGSNPQCAYTLAQPQTSRGSSPRWSRRLSRQGSDTRTSSKTGTQEDDMPIGLAFWVIMLIWLVFGILLTWA